MRTLTVFNFITLNGYYKDVDNDISWHQHGGEEGAYSEEMLAEDTILLFGRITYEMMASFWPTQMAKESMPVVAEGMNRAEKIVFSKTLTKASWHNTTIVKGGIVEEIKKLKQTSGKDLVVLGSGTILTQFAEAGIIDKYECMIDPVVIGQGTPIFKDITKNLNLKLIETRVFKSGIVLLCYEPKNK